MGLLKFLLERLTGARTPPERALWRTMYVGDYKTAPTWAYTIGFPGAPEQAELIVFDVPKPSAENIFSHVYAELKAGRPVVADGAEMPGGGEGRFVWRKVHPDQLYEWLTFAWTARLIDPDLGELAAYQLVLGDAQRRMPWEPGYDESLRHLQRALWLPPEETTEAP
jgi:hypothetical protein